MHVTRPELPVILCSGYSEYIDEDALRKANIVDYFEKPLVTKKLLATVNKYSLKEQVA